MGPRCVEKGFRVYTSHSTTVIYQIRSFFFRLPNILTFDLMVSSVFLGT